MSSRRCRMTGFRIGSTTDPETQLLLRRDNSVMGDG